MAGAPLPEGGRYEQLCFFAQQAAEKALKAALVHLGADFPYTHNLQLLVDLLPAKVPLAPEHEQVAGLTFYAVAGRYPRAMSPVSAGEHAEALALAAAVVRWAELLVEAAPN
jgi:HEPN domain-containing protein